MLKRVVFWGAAGHAKVLRELVERLGYTLVAMFDNNPQIISPFPNVPVYWGTDGFKQWLEGKEEWKLAGLVAIGGSRGRDRLEIQKIFEANYIETLIAVHPTAFVAPGARVSSGCQILANAAVCVDVSIGEACIINTAASVDHETLLGKGVHIAPGAVLAGCVSVGDFSMIGAGAVILPRIEIGKDVIVGAGSVVTKNVPDGQIVYGNPARIRRSNAPR